MSDPSAVGVVYTEYLSVRATTPVASLWSFHSCERGRGRRAIVQHADGSQEYWLERSDPLLNTILPGMAVSIVVNFGDQAHMINEFRTLAGAPPTTFFRPHDAGIDPAPIQVRGRPSEWLQRDKGNASTDRRGRDERREQLLSRL
jgi:AraC-like DNA-binding protein